MSGFNISRLGTLDTYQPTTFTYHRITKQCLISVNILLLKDTWNCSL